MLRKGNYDGNKEMYFFVDPETNMDMPISKRTYDAIKTSNEELHKRINPEGKIIGSFVSTMADDTRNEDFKQLWNDNQSK